MSVTNLTDDGNTAIIQIVNEIPFLTRIIHEENFPLSLPLFSSVGCLLFSFSRIVNIGFPTSP